MRKTLEATPRTGEMTGKKLRLSKSVVGEAEAQAVGRVLREDGYLGMGREVDAFETEIAEFLGVPRQWVIAVNSGTAALHLAVQAVVPPGQEVLVQSLTFVATFQAISAAGAVPVACEVKPETITLDLDDARRRLSPRTRAIMPVHYASYPGDLEGIYGLAREHGLRVIEDAAHAFGCTFKGRKIGALADIACFSFDGIKNITSGEGGVVVTGDAQAAQRIRDARLLGVERDTESRFAGKRSWDFDVQGPGYRYHLSNILAAIGRVQLQRFPREFGPSRVRLARLYRARLAGISAIRLLNTDLEQVVPHIQPILVLNGRRDELRQFLGARGIETGIHYKPNHLLTYFGAQSGQLPVTERLYGELLSLPLHPELSEADVHFVADNISEFFRGR